MPRKRLVYPRERVGYLEPLVPACCQESAATFGRGSACPWAPVVLRYRRDQRFNIVRVWPMNDHSIGRLNHDHLLLVSTLLVCISTSLAVGQADELPAALERMAIYQASGLTLEGNPQRGQELFQDPQRIKCHACHRVHGQGGEVGPDLSAIAGKFDRPHLIESLLEPSRQIVEGYRVSSIVTDDGRVLTGLIKHQSDTQVQLVDANAKQYTLDRARIEEISATALSLMPSNLAELMTVDEFTDLIAYLETLRPGGPRTPGADIIGAVKIPRGFRIRTVATGLTGSTAMEMRPTDASFSANNQARCGSFSTTSYLPSHS